MPGTPTSRLSLPTIVAATDSVSSYPAAHNAAVASLDASAMYAEGTLASRPGSPSPASGLVYRATDTGQVFVSSAGAWLEFERLASKGAANGYAGLDSGGHVPLSLLSGITLSQLAAGVARWNVVSTTASTYTASDGQYVFAYGGTGQTINLPASPQASNQVMVFAVNQSSPVGSTAVIVNGNGNNVSGLGLSVTQTFQLGSPNTYAWLMFDGGRWVILSGQPDTGWVSLAIPSGFAATGGAFVPAMRKIGDRAWFRGAVTNTSGSPAGFFTNIPTGMSPSSNVNVGFTTSVAGPGSLSIASTTISATNIPASAQLYLDGLNYSVS